ncbi:iron-sulfur cluster assembly protein [Saccharomycopsis crataegensis]|uniref:Probable cytosolic iron-sulfur protein assembly protein 1 n=1 Tax=Saccharomycopsis crataegensis TaxID=43959 RepID=A0AAV5QRZ1_9ASCO|nr:iron-sulfur cluster assembly protein [Saccharomycopsis crataegensis]
MVANDKIKLVRTLRDHNNKVWSVATHQSLPLLATASADKTIIVYDLNNFNVITKLSETHQKSIRSVSWKPSSEFPCLAAGSFDSTMSIWAKTDENFEEYSDDDDIDDDGAQEGNSTNKQWSLMAIIEGHENEIKCVSWSADGNYLASCSRDKTVWIWETDEYNEEFECINVLQDYHSQDVKFIKWGPDQCLISASYDDTIKVFKEPSPGDDLTCVCDLNAHDGTVWAIDFEPMEVVGTKHWRFVSCSDDSSVKVWALTEENRSEELEDWQLQAKLPIKHKGSIYSVSWSANSGRIASVGSDGNLIIYKEIESGKWEIDSIKPLAHGVFDLNCVVWIKNIDESATTERLITGGDNGTVNIWEIEM